MLDYLAFATCSTPWAPMWLVAVGLMLILMYMLMLLASTADRYFVPPLMVISEKLRLSPSVAGCTLVAFGVWV